jgi:AraC-like DNA-binding protein
VVSKTDINYRMPALRLLHGAQREGLNLGKVLTAASIEQDSASTLEQEVDNIQFIALLRCIQSLLGDEFYGLSTRKLKKGSIAMMTEIALHSKNLEGSLLGIHRFIGLITDDFEVNLSHSGGEARVELVQHNQYTDPDFFLSDYLLFYFHRLCSWLIGYLIPVSTIQFKGPEGNGSDRFIDLISSSWSPNNKNNAMTFNAKYLSMPVVRNSIEWLQHVDNVRGGLFSWPKNNDWVSNKVKNVIMQSLESKQYNPTLDEVAQSLAMSSQTLRRRLQEENTSFQVLTDRLRCDLAIEALYIQQLSIEKVSELLGFSEARSFSRAFKKWTGIPPTEYLRRAAAAKS